MRKEMLYILRFWFVLGGAPLLFGQENGGTYSPLGKRDPFQVPKQISRDVASPETDLFKYTLEQFQLRAILKGGKKLS